MEKQPRGGKITVEEVRHPSLYEFWDKFALFSGKLSRTRCARILMVTPGFPADCASVLHDRHNDYARSAVGAHWRLMPTDLRHELLEARCAIEPQRLEWSDPRRTIEWSATKLAPHRERLLGVEDLVRAFDNDKVDRKGRKLCWAMALMEMLVDPMLVAWVPSGLREQYERRNPFSRACLRQALDTCADEYVKPRDKKPTCKTGEVKPPPEPPKELEEKTENPYFIEEPRHRTNKRLLRLVRQRMIVRFLRRKAEDPEGDADVDAGDAKSDDDGREPGRESASEKSGDDDLDDAAKRLREEVAIIRDELPTADGVEQLAPGANAWDRATAEQRLSAAHSAPHGRRLVAWPGAGGAPPGRRERESARVCLAADGR